MGKIGFIADDEEEEEIYIPRSYVGCPICNDEFRTDELPSKKEDKKHCSCKNLELGFMPGSCKVSARVGGTTGFFSVKWLEERPLFFDRAPPDE